MDSLELHKKRKEKVFYKGTIKIIIQVPTTSSYYYSPIFIGKTKNLDTFQCQDKTPAKLKVQDFDK